MMRIGRGTKGYGLAAALVLVASLSVALPSAGAAAPAESGATWTTCQNGAARCLHLTVPLDYDHPGGPTVSLAVMEEWATDRSATDGVLFYNPGGPGESGVEFLPVFANLLPPEIRQHFDLVSFDERGTGQSAHLTCGPPPRLAASVDPLPGPHEPVPAARIYGDLAASCDRAAKALTPTMTTANSARDMDRVRQALGVSKISFWGGSYGTVLGSVYAHLFPSHVKAMVLDGAVDATLSLGQQASEEAPAAEASLMHYLSTCQAQPACPLGTDPEQAFQTLATRLAAHPLAAPGQGDETPVGVGDLDSATLLYLSVPEYASGYPAALTAAQAGNGAPLRTLALDFWTDIDGSSLVGPLWAITCNDAARHLGAAAAGNLARSLAARYPLIGAYAVTYDLSGCVNWPRAPHPVTSVANSGAPTILVISNTGDPNTPHRWGVQLTAAIGKAQLLTWRGWGHQWILNGSSDPCMQAAVSAYLLAGTLPAPGATCS